MPRGVRDFSPKEAISIRYIVEIAEEVFKRFGFYPLETPAIENMSILNAKAYGDEPAKEIYQLEGKEEGLRYDFTVPLARYVASNKDLVLPFKRYQIGNIWRKDEPQKMRYREFLQADIDIVGSKEVESDAETVAAAATALEELGIRKYKIAINSRQLLEKILGYFKVPEAKQMQVIRTLDKLEKTGRDEVSRQLVAAGLDARTSEDLLNFVEQTGAGEEKLERISANIEGCKEEVNKMQKLFGALAEYQISGEISLDLALARGLDYYTGFIFEFVIEEDGKRLPTIAGGGRYDRLIGLYSKREVPAVGISIGISRIYDLLASKDGAKTYAKAFIAYLGEKNRAYAIGVANQLRANGVYVDINTTSRNLSKQMEYAGSLGIKNTIIIGDTEREANKLKLRDMSTGEEELISLQEAIEKLRS